MFDYIGGYQAAVRSRMTASDLIEAANSIRAKHYYFKNQELQGLPADLMFVNNHQIDWGMFAPRWGRIQGLMRSVLVQARLPEGAAGSFSAFV